MLNRVNRQWIVSIENGQFGNNGDNGVGMHVYQSSFMYTSAFFATTILCRPQIVHWLEKKVSDHAPCIET